MRTNADEPFCQFLCASKKIEDHLDVRAQRGILNCSTVPVLELCLLAMSDCYSRVDALIGDHAGCLVQRMSHERLVDWGLPLGMFVPHRVFYYVARSW